MHIAKLRITSKRYLQARKEFLNVANSTSELSGNDNIVGRIGEFIAYQFLSGRNARKNDNKTEKGFDIICDRHTKISVKTITYENETQRTTRVKEPWDELILIVINDNCAVEKIGHLTKSQFKRAIQDNHHWSNEPYCKLTMLGLNGLIGKYGKVYSSAELKDKVFL